MKSTDLKTNNIRQYYEMREDKVMPSCLNLKNAFDVALHQKPNLVNLKEIAEAKEKLKREKLRMAGKTLIDLSSLNTSARFVSNLKEKYKYSVRSGQAAYILKSEISQKQVQSKPAEVAVCVSKKVRPQVSDRILADKVPASEVPTDKVSAEEIPAGEVITDKVLTEEVSAGEVITDKVLTEEVSAEEKIKESIFPLFSVDAIEKDENELAVAKPVLEKPLQEGFERISKPEGKSSYGIISQPEIAPQPKVAPVPKLKEFKFDKAAVNFLLPDKSANSKIEFPTFVKRIHGFFDNLKHFNFKSKTTREKPRIAQKSHRVQGWQKSLAVFTVICLFLTGTVGAFASYEKTKQTKVDVMTKAEKGAMKLKNAGKNVMQESYEGANTDFDVAARYFIEAKRDIENLGLVTSTLIAIFPEGVNGSAILNAGEAISRVGTRFSNALSYFKKVGNVFEGIEGVEAVKIEDEVSLLEALKKSSEEFKKVSEDLKYIDSELSKVKEKKLPGNIVSQVKQMKVLVPAIIASTDYFLSVSSDLQKLLGADGKNRVALVFTNVDERRGVMGGFPGSLMIMDIDNGKITNSDFRDIYELRGQQVDKIEPPEPLKYIAGNFEIQDSSWFIGYPETAEKFMHFYELSGGTTLDGVITITSDVVPEILEVTGPIELPDFGTTITAENFLTEMEREVESDEARASSAPKKIVEDFMEEFFKKISSLGSEDWIPLARALNDALKKKEILMYFKDSKLESFAEKNSVSGKVENFSKDYLSVLTYNIGGGKTDKDMDESLSHEARINNDGKVTVKFDISRTLKPNDDLSKVKNVSFVKVAVPKGSELVSADGLEAPYRTGSAFESFKKDFDVETIKSSAKEFYDGKLVKSEESDKTIFGFWMGVDVGKTRDVKLEYILPDKLDLTKFMDNVDSYDFLVQKQPGSNFNFQSSLYLPSDAKAVWHDSSSSPLSIDGKRLELKAHPLTFDEYYSIVLEKE